MPPVVGDNRCLQLPGAGRLSFLAQPSGSIDTTQQMPDELDDYNGYRYDPGRLPLSPANVPASGTVQL
jgi:hypothetical protein